MGFDEWDMLSAEDRKEIDKEIEEEALRRETEEIDMFVRYVLKPNGLEIGDILWTMRQNGSSLEIEDKVFPIFMKRKK